MQNISDIIYSVSENLFDLVVHMNTEICKLRGKLKSLRPLPNSFCKFKELIKVIATTIDSRNEEMKKNSRIR